MSSICTPLSCFSGSRKGMVLKVRLPTYDACRLIPCSDHFMRYNDFDVVFYLRWRGTRYMLQSEKLWISRSVLRFKRDLATRFKMCWSVSTRDLSNWRRPSTKSTWWGNTRFTALGNTPNIPLNNFDFVSFASILESSEEDKTIGKI